MKKFITTLILLGTISIFSGCSNGTKLKKIFVNLDPKCQKIVNEIQEDIRYNSDQIVLISIIVSQCQNTQEILKAIEVQK